MKQPIKDEVAENMNIAEMAVTVLGESYLFDKRFLPSNIGLLLRKL